MGNFFNMAMFGPRPYQAPRNSYTETTYNYNYGSNFGYGAPFYGRSRGGFGLFALGASIPLFSGLFGLFGARRSHYPQPYQPAASSLYQTADNAQKHNRDLALLNSHTKNTGYTWYLSDDGKLWGLNGNIEDNLTASTLEEAMQMLKEKKKSVSELKINSDHIDEFERAKNEFIESLNKVGINLDSDTYDVTAEPDGDNYKYTITVKNDKEDSANLAGIYNNAVDVIKKVKIAEKNANVGSSTIVKVNGRDVNVTDLGTTVNNLKKDYEIAFYNSNNPNNLQGTVQKVEKDNEGNVVRFILKTTNNTYTFAKKPDEDETYVLMFFNDKPAENEKIYKYDGEKKILIQTEDSPGGSQGANHSTNVPKSWKNVNSNDVSKYSRLETKNADNVAKKIITELGLNADEYNLEEFTKILIGANSEIFDTSGNAKNSANFSQMKIPDANYLNMAFKKYKSGEEKKDKQNP